MFCVGFELRFRRYGRLGELLYRSKRLLADHAHARTGLILPWARALADFAHLNILGLCVVLRPSARLA